MLIEGFYSVIEFEYSDSEIKAAIALDENHSVYKGHFADQPVVPGVIQIQIIKELLEQKLDAKLILNNLIQVKYLSLIIPDNSSKLQIVISIKNTEDATVKIVASISTSEKIHTKAKLEFAVC